MSKLYALDGAVPHPDYKGWRNFLKTCELRAEKNGVRHYGKTNCNYVVWPCGLIVRNYGYHGTALMSLIAEQGAKPVKENIIKDHKLLEELCKKQSLA